ncbi:nucleotidyltransferase family protein [Cyanobacteria bacterium FACHB-63]|nr:nucleotidyltransferase family protein [Cyanobacteria bacterium FACHB-63]
MQNIQGIQIALDQEKIIQFCQRWKITEFALFGSVLRDDFRPNESDIDVLVSFDQEAHWTLFDLVEMEEEIQKIFDRKVDLISRRGIERSRNYLRRKAILDSAKVIYAAS